MKRKLHLRVLAVVAAAALSATAMAGDGEYEPDGSHEEGVPFFGEVKNIKTFEPVPSAIIKLQQQGTQRFVLFQSDSEGRFRRSGLGPDVEPEKIDISCEKQGFRTIDVMRRRLSSAKDAPVEVECLLEKN